MGGGVQICNIGMLTSPPPPQIFEKMMLSVTTPRISLSAYHWSSSFWIFSKLSYKNRQQLIWLGLHKTSKSLGTNKNSTRQSRSYAENPHGTVNFQRWPPSGSLFRKNKKTFFRCGLGERVYQISGPYRFWFGQKAWHREINKYINTYKWK